VDNNGGNDCFRWVLIFPMTKIFLYEFLI
jgi:hypothetical protein